MYRCLTAFTAGALLVGSTLTTAARQLETLLPADVPFFIKVKNASQLAQDWEQHPLVKHFNTPEVRKAFMEHIEASQAPVQPWMMPQDGSQESTEETEPTLAEQIEAETGVTIERLTELLPGQWVISMPLGENMDAILDGEGEDDFILIANHNGDIEALEAIMRHSAEHDSQEGFASHKIRKEQYKDAQLYLEEVESGEDLVSAGGYVIAGDILAAATQPEMLRSIVDHLDSEDDTLGQSAFYQKVSADAGESDGLFYLNAAPLHPYLEKSVRESMEPDGQQQNPMAPKADQLLKVLNMGAIEGGFISFNLEEDISTYGGGAYISSRQGITSLLDAYHKSDLPQPQFIPADASSMSVFNLSLGTGFQRLETLVIEAVPMIGFMYQGQLAQIEANTGINLRQLFLDGFGDHMVSVGIVTPQPEFEEPMEQTVLAIALNNRQSIESALENVKGLAGASEMFTETDFLGFSLFSTPNDTFSYVVTDEYLFITMGPAAPLREVLSVKDKGGKTLWKSEALDQGRKLLSSDDLVGVSLADMSQLFRLIGGYLEITPEGTGAIMDAANNMPGYYIYSTNSLNEEGIFSHSVVYPKEEQ